MKNKYLTDSYITKSRWASFWSQIDSVVKTKPKTILEVGKGSAVVSQTLMGLGYKLKTLDADKRTNPDFVGDIRRLPFKNNSFDTVLCAEVLEHLPFTDFEKSVSELRRVSKKYIIISVPEPYGTNFYFGLKIIPFIPKFEVYFKLGFKELFFSHFQIGIHQWEIGRNDVSLSKIKSIFKRLGFTLEKTFYPKDNLYHRFFILRKNRSKLSRKSLFS